MSLMRAVQVSGPGSDLELVWRKIPDPGEREVLIKVEACGVCHGEVTVKEGLAPGLVYPRIPGHEVVGTIAAIGPGVTGWERGTRVGVGWSGGPCTVCPACARGEYRACADAVITGLTVDGGYAEYMVARASALVDIPVGLGSLEAAPLLCAGATTYSALNESGAVPGDLVAIHGIGGLGHLAVQYANRLGFRTVALSRGPDKEALARELGADMYVDAASSDPCALLQEQGGAKVILCTAPDAKAISGLIGGLGPGGQLIVVAGASEPLQFHARLLFRGDLSIKGWHGRRPAEAVDFSVRRQVLPLIETFALEEAAEAFERMMAARVRFRGVLDVGVPRTPESIEC